jgi:papain like protease
MLLACLTVAHTTETFSQISTTSDATQRHGQGLLLDTDEDLAGIARTPDYRAFLPDKVDLTTHFPKPGDQGDQNSCVGWAVGYAARSYYVNKSEGRDISDSSNVPSPAYIYNSILKLPDQCDRGSKVSDALNLLKSGSLSMSQFPYSQDSCSRPSNALRLAASDFRISGWILVNKNRPDQVKAELAHGNPVILALRTTKAFHRLRRGEIYRHPDEPTGFHSLTAVGYDESRQAFKLINSWGPDWADQGFGWIDYETFRSEVQFAYAMRVALAPNPRPERPPAPVATPMPAPPLPAPRPEAQPSPSPVVLTPSTGLPELECAQVRRVERDGKPVLVGFVGREEDLDRVRTVAGGAEVQVALMPWPQCEALLTLDKPLSRSERPRVTIRKSSGDVLVAGDRLVMDVQTPAHPSYVHIAYFQADGTVLNLVQPGVGSFKVQRPSSRIVIGDESASGPRFRVAPPFGNEMVLVLAGKSPIFSDARPTKETEREFLTALRRALIAKPSPTSPDRDVTANYDSVVTVERRGP